MRRHCLRKAIRCTSCSSSSSVRPSGCCADRASSDASTCRSAVRRSWPATTLPRSTPCACRSSCAGGLRSSPRASTSTAQAYGGGSWRGCMRGAGQIAIDRSDPDAAAQALDVAREVIDAGDVWAIYPEGTRSPDGRLYRGHTGVMRVALSRDVPVMPVTLTGTERLDPRDRRGLRPARRHGHHRCAARSGRDHGRPRGDRSAHAGPAGAVGPYLRRCVRATVTKAARAGGCPRDR